MNLTTFISTYNGKTIGDGQCGALVDLYLVDVFGNHTTYATALDYWKNGIPGFVVTTSPQPGNIACYNAHGTYVDGHIAVYAGGGEVFEQNADPDGSPAHLFARANTYLLGYLTKENEMTTEQATKIALYARLLGFQSVAQANAENASDVPYVQASADNIGQLLEDLYKSALWQSHNTAATVLNTGLYEVK